MGRASRDPIGSKLRKVGNLERLRALDALRLLHALTYPSAFDDFFYFLMLDLRFAPRRSTRRKSPFAYPFWCAFDLPDP